MLAKLKALEIGPGDHPVFENCPEYTWVTAGPAGCNAVVRWGYERLPFKTDEFSLVYASHVIEHIEWSKTIDALKEVHRVLKPEGTVEIWTVSFDYLVDCYLQEECGDQWRRDNPLGNYMLWIAGRIFGYPNPDQPWNEHRALFDYDHLEHCFCQAGFRSVNKLNVPRGYDHGKVNLGVRATK